MNIYTERLGELRKTMEKRGIDLFLIVSSDYHASEYVGDFYKVSEFFSGCTSDNVKLLIGIDEAKLWTDGRYFISAAAELKGTGIGLMKSGEKDVPKLEEYLEEVLQEGMTLAFDGLTVDAMAGDAYHKIAEKKHVRIITDMDPAEGIWTDRPCLPKNKIMMLDEGIAGASFEEKLANVREAMELKDASSLMLSRLDDICWLFNIRGRDVACNPVALAYAFITLDSVHLFIQKEERTEDFDAWARDRGITVLPYGDTSEFLKSWEFDGPCMFDPGAVSFHLAENIRGRTETVETDNPTELMKAVKNPTEIGHLKKIYLLDSVAVCRFIYWFKANVGLAPMTELSAAERLDSLRARIPGFLELSFPTISAYGANAAIAHYAATEESDAEIEPCGFLLVDSGGQYMGGTTDVTRTLRAGDLSEDERRAFTLVAISHLNLLNARFRYGVTGRFLDAYARAPLWEHGIDYNHGTGHGIGYILNVHEGPQVIRWKYCPGQKEAVFEPGMIISDEPGVYIEGEYGVRTESILLTVEDETNAFGRFLRFEPLTFVPIDLDAIDTAYMQPKDIRRLNAYHALVWEKISPSLHGEELAWLREATRAIEG